MKKQWYSNCLLEAIEAKWVWGNYVKIIYIPSWRNEIHCPHFLWCNKIDDTINDFHCDRKFNKWYEIFWFEGYIRTRPYSVYEKWTNTRGW